MGFKLFESSTIVALDIMGHCEKKWICTSSKFVNIK
jgi:hypothetical protein